MVFINPWASYNTEDIPDLNPHNDEEEKGCIGGIVAFCISSLIFIMLMYAAVTLVNNNIIDTKIMMIFVVVNIAIFVTLTIMLMKLSLKIADKFTKKQKIMVTKGKITFSGEIGDFELITRKDLIERGYKYMEKVSGIFYKDYEVDFDVTKDKYYTEVKLTFNNGKEIKLDGAEINSIIPTVRGTFTVFLPAKLTPAFYGDVKKIEIK